MKRGASLLAPKSDTACLARFCVANRTNEPILNSLVLPLSLLSAFSFCRSTEAAKASWTNRMTAYRRWTKSTAFELNAVFSSVSLFTTGPDCVCCSLLFKVSTPGVDTVLLLAGLHAVRARVDTADMLVISACLFGFGKTGYPPPGGASVSAGVPRTTTGKICRKSANAMSASLSAQRLTDCTGVRAGTSCVAGSCTWPNGKACTWGSRAALAELLGGVAGRASVQHNACSVQPLGPALHSRWLDSRRSRCGYCGEPRVEAVPLTARSVQEFSDARAQAVADAPAAADSPSDASSARTPIPATDQANVQADLGPTAPAQARLDVLADLVSTADI
ncbi:unnamed protein product [Phytophthora fragariaefolia]|uniref:Unnamed protein product n=1 Tax=Phytophthora fragariaefolia TaxID=1490495 RepID=A0A9W6YE25_9STRA|nr:unnamed protein product [Phytophthora fragariaefolia]